MAKTKENAYVVSLSNYFSNDFPDKENATEEQKFDFLREFGYKRHYTRWICSPSEFSRAFRKYVHVVLLDGTNEFAVYNRKKGIYEINCDEILCKLIKACMDFAGDLWNPTDEASALKAIRHDTTEMVNHFNNGDFVILQDGVLDLNSYQLCDYSPRYYGTVQLPFRYGSNQKTPVFERYLDDVTCGDAQLKLVLQEVAGSALCNSTAAEKAFFLVGSGSNGKSVFAGLLQKLVGEGNYSNTSLSALNGQFGLASLINSNVNIAAENNSDRINSEIFKAIVSGDTVEVNRKYKDSISVKLHTKLVMLFNTLPESTDLSYGFFRKVLIIPFDRKITQEERDVMLMEKLQEELAGIFRWAIDGLKRLRANNYQFTPCKACEDALEAYKHLLNPVASIFGELYEVAENKSTLRREVYERYEAFCIKNGHEVMQRQKFWRAFKAHLDDVGIPYKIKKIHGYEHIEGIIMAKATS